MYHCHNWYIEKQWPYIGSVGTWEIEPPWYYIRYECFCDGRVLKGVTGPLTEIPQRGDGSFMFLGRLHMLGKYDDKHDAAIRIQSACRRYYLGHRNYLVYKILLGATPLLPVDIICDMMKYF